MNIKELKEIISDLPDNMEVILSDEDGNQYLPAQDYNKSSVYNHEDGNVVETKWSAEDNGFESEKEFKAYVKKNNKVLILYP